MASITLTTAAKNAACDAVVDLVDVGAGSSTIVLATSGVVEVATCTFSATAFGNAALGVATANAITDDAAATGNASAVEIAIIKDGDGLEVWRQDVGTSGASLNLSSVNIGAGDTVTISAFTVTMPAS